MIIINSNARVDCALSAIGCVMDLEIAYVGMMRHHLHVLLLVS